MPTKNENVKSPIESDPITITNILEGKNPIAYLQNNSSWLIDPQFPEPKKIIDLKPEQTPKVNNFRDYKFSPSKKFITWYTPELGLLILNISSNTIKPIHKPNDWLNNNPFFVFSQKSDTLFFVDNLGSDLISINLTTEQTTTTSIPYPFGNLFRISPDESHILYISGFTQTKKTPQYMIATINGSNPYRFTTNTRPNKRELVDWSSDSSGLIIVENDTDLTYIPIDTSKPKQLLYQSPSKSPIESLQRLGSYIFFSTRDRWWQIFDSKQNKIISRIPLEIAKEIHRPNFIPWHDNTFLIEETLRLDPEQFNRLWITTFTGIKKLVIPKFQEVNLSNNTPSL